METCTESWVSRRLVSPAASLRCSSSRYPAITIVSVPCDGVVECSDGADEAACTKQALSNYLLAGSIALILIWYLLLKLYRRCKRKNVSRIIRRNRLFLKSGTKSLEMIQEDFETSRNKAKLISDVNAYLFNIVHSKKTLEMNEKFKNFFEALAKTHGNDEAKIFHSLHQCLDP